MDELKKKALGFEYVTNPDKLKDDVLEFANTFASLLSLLEDGDAIKTMDAFDLVNLMCCIKSFNDEIKPFVIKYGILPNIVNKTCLNCRQLYEPAMGGYYCKLFYKAVGYDDSCCNWESND